MPDGPIRVARILVTIPAVFLAVVPALADFNTSHVTNPLWPAHARLHTVWLVCTTSLLSLLALGILWGRREQPHRGVVLLSAAILGSVLLGFFVAGATRSSYGGAFADPNGVAIRFAGLDANLLGFAVMAVMLAAGVAVASRSAA